MTHDTSYIRRKASKLKAIYYLGGKCQRCGNNNIHHLCFHHKHDKKINTIANGKFSWSRLKNELDKCELLCQNCHREHHYNEVKNPSKSSLARRKCKQLLLNFKNIFNCEKCGYSKCNESLNFHHYADNKKYNIKNIVSKQISDINKVTEDMKNEINKCKIICSNCHTEEHTDVNKFEKYKNIILERINTYKEKQKEIEYEQILVDCLIQRLSTKDIAEKLGVAERTVRVRIKKYERRNNVTFPYMHRSTDPKYIYKSKNRGNLGSRKKRATTKLDQGT